MNANATKSRPKSKPAAKPVSLTMQVREEVGRVVGRKLASRGMIAKLLGSSPGSVFNWERGKEPSKHFQKKLESLLSRAKLGTLDVKAPQRGRKPKPHGPRLGGIEEIARSYAAGLATARARLGSTPASEPPKSESKSESDRDEPLYVNEFKYRLGKRDVFLRFMLVSGGDIYGYEDLILPYSLAEDLGKVLSASSKPPKH